MISIKYGATYNIDTTDKENPYVNIKKDNVSLKLHVNTDVVEVSINNKKSFRSNSI